MGDLKDIKPGGDPRDTGNDPTATLVPDPAIFKPGKYTFSLVVSDKDGIASEAATTVVEIRAKPIARIAGKTPVGLGQTITLSGKESAPATADAPITLYTWTVTGPA
jgi:hypothetical protein